MAVVNLREEESVAAVPMLHLVVKLLRYVQVSGHYHEGQEGPAQKRQQDHVPRHHAAVCDH